MTDQEQQVVSESVRQSFDSLVESAKSLDVDRYLNHFDAARYSGLNEDGSVSHTLEDFGETIRQQFPMIEKYVSLEFENVKITPITDSIAVLVNEYSASVQLKTGDVVSASGGGTQVWARTDLDWKLVSVSSVSHE